MVTIIWQLCRRNVMWCERQLMCTRGCAQLTNFVRRNVSHSVALMWSPTRPTGAAGTPPTIDFTDTHSPTNRNRHRDVTEKNFATSPGPHLFPSFASLGDALILGDELLGALLDIRPRSVQPAMEHASRWRVWATLAQIAAVCIAAHGAAVALGKGKIRVRA